MGMVGGNSGYLMSMWRREFTYNVVSLKRMSRRYIKNEAHRRNERHINSRKSKMFKKGNVIKLYLQLSREIYGSNNYRSTKY